MWRRKCPLCFVRIPWTASLAHSYEITCPACHAPLELSRFTRLIGALGGITGAFLTLHLVRAIYHDLFWTTPIVVSFLAFGFLSALFVLIAGDVALRPKPAAAASFPHPGR
jgi:hypothetical protein